VIYNLGLNGLATLVAMSAVFGLVVGAISWRAASHWIGPIGAVAFFLGGLFTSEVMFASATAAELQPNIDGLSFDEALLGGLILGLAATIVSWYVTRHRTGGQHHPKPA
jgi:hypothetical protein